MRWAVPAAVALISQIQADVYPYASSIFKAARDGEIHSVRHFFTVDRKFNANQVDSWNKTAVHYSTVIEYREIRRKKTLKNAENTHKNTLTLKFGPGSPFGSRFQLAFLKLLQLNQKSFKISRKLNSLWIPRGLDFSFSVFSRLMHTSSKTVWSCR